MGVAFVAISLELGYGVIWEAPLLRYGRVTAPFKLSLLLFLKVVPQNPESIKIFKIFDILKLF